MFVYSLWKISKLNFPTVSSGIILVQVKVAIGTLYFTKTTIYKPATPNYSIKSSIYFLIRAYNHKFQALIQWPFPKMGTTGYRS